jgi:hypothetical protein
MGRTHVILVGLTQKYQKTNRQEVRVWESYCAHSCLGWIGTRVYV